MLTSAGHYLAVHRRPLPDRLHTFCPRCAGTGPLGAATVAPGSLLRRSTAGRGETGSGCHLRARQPGVPVRVPRRTRRTARRPTGITWCRREGWSAGGVGLRRRKRSYSPPARRPLTGARPGSTVRPRSWSQKVPDKFAGQVLPWAASGAARQQTRSCRRKQNAPTPDRRPPTGRTSPAQRTPPSNHPFSTRHRRSGHPVVIASNDHRCLKLLVPYTGPEASRGGEESVPRATAGIAKEEPVNTGGWHQVREAGDRAGSDEGRRARGEGVRARRGRRQSITSRHRAFINSRTTGTSSSLVQAPWTR